MADKAAELSVWEVLLVLAYSMMKQIVKQYKRRILIYRYSFLLWKNIKMTLLIIKKTVPFKCSFFKSIKVMGSSSVFTNCVLNYAISMSNLPCSKSVGIWAWFTTRGYWRCFFEGTLQSWTNLMDYNCFIPNCNYSLGNAPNLHNKLLQNPLTL